jgi:hypothetical protein
MDRTSQQSTSFTTSFATGFAWGGLWVVSFADLADLFSMFWSFGALGTEPGLLDHFSEDDTSDGD